MRFCIHGRAALSEIIWKKIAIAQAIRNFLKPKFNGVFNTALKRCSTQIKIRTKITSDVRTTFVPVDVHNLPVLMCNYTGKEVV